MREAVEGSKMRRFVLASVLLVSATAFAQESPPPTTPAPVAAPAETAAQAPTATPAPTAAPAPVAPAREPFVRIRAGADGAPALFVPGISYGANFSGRIGVQLKKMWGVYADVGGGFGFGGSISAGAGGGGVSINVADYWRLMFMAEADIGRMFFVSFGPGVCGCTFGGINQIATAQGASQAAWVSGGYDAALMARVGLGIGRGRNKFTIALENMVAFGKMTQVSQNASMAGADQSVRIGHLAVGWAPGIVFGWDMR
jgi:hypothetical protein